MNSIEVKKDIVEEGFKVSQDDCKTIIELQKKTTRQVYRNKYLDFRFLHRVFKKLTKTSY